MPKLRLLLLILICIVLVFKFVNPRAYRSRMSAYAQHFVYALTGALILYWLLFILGPLLWRS